MDVKRLAATCEFGALKEELIRDRIVLGIADEALSQSLQLEATLDLDKCITRVMSAERVTQNSSNVRVNGNVTLLLSCSMDPSKNVTSLDFTTGPAGLSGSRKR